MYTARTAEHCSHVLVGLHKRLGVGSSSGLAAHALAQWELWGLCKVIVEASNETVLLETERLAKGDANPCLHIRTNIRMCPAQNLFSHSVSDGDLPSLQAGQAGKTVVAIGPAPTARLSSITKSVTGLQVMT